MFRSYIDHHQGVFYIQSVLKLKNNSGAKRLICHVWRFVPCASEITVGTWMQWHAIDWRRENWNLNGEWQQAVKVYNMQLQNCNVAIVDCSCIFRLLQSKHNQDLNSIWKGNMISIYIPGTFSLFTLFSRAIVINYTN